MSSYLQTLSKIQPHVYYNNDEDGYMEFAFLKSLRYVHELPSFDSLKVMYNQAQTLGFGFFLIEMF